MEIYNYRICGLHIRIEAEKKIWLEPCGEIFACPSGQEELRLVLRSVPELTVPTDGVFGSSGEHPVFRDGAVVSRYSRDMFRRQPHARTDYRTDSPGAAQCFVREEDWLWATRTKYLWTGFSINQLMLPFKTLFFHASYIGHNGRGMLFVAPGGTGKSTQAELWRRHRGAVVLNGDKAGVSLRDIPMAHGVPFSGTSEISENVSLPLRCVVVLSQAAENSVRRLGAAEALSSLTPNVFADMTVATEWRQTLALLLDLVAAVPVYSLACTPDERAVETLEAAMSRDENQRRVY